MTFRGFEYQTVLDIQRTLMVAEAERRVYELDLKTKRLQRNMPMVQELEVSLNIQDKFIESLKALIDDLTEKMNVINNEFNDLEGKIFLEKFLHGTSNTDLMIKYSISKSTLFRIFDSIDKHLYNDNGKDLKRALTK